MLRVSIHTQGEGPRVLEFPYDRRVRFGRAPDNDIVLPPSYVSRYHGEFLWEDGAWYVIDQGSMSGLRLRAPDGPEGGVQVPAGRPELLSGGETLEILHTLLKVDVKPPEDSIASVFDPDTLDNTITVTRSARFARADEIGRQLGRGADAGRLNLLLQLGKDLNRLQGLDEVLDRIADTIFEALPHASHFAVCVPDDQGRFRAHAARLRSGEETAPDQIGVSQGVLGWVSMRQTAMLFDRSASHASLSETMIAHRVASSIAVPLGSGLGALGVMQIDNRESDTPFDQHDLDFALVLAGHAAAALERARFQQDLRRTFEGFVDASVTAIEARDPTTSGHSRRVADLTHALARAAARHGSERYKLYRMDEEQLTELSYAALLHDFGKVGVPECVLLKARRLYPEQLERIESRYREIAAAHHADLLADAVGRGESGPDVLKSVQACLGELTSQLEDELSWIRALDLGAPTGPADRARLEGLLKRTFTDVRGRTRPYLEPPEVESLCIAYGTLTPEQRLAIESHVTQSYKVLQQIHWPPSLARVPEIVVAHHEKLDGSGYPQGLRRHEIPPPARVLAICDIFDALTASDRPYRSALPVEHCLDALRTEARQGKVEADLVELFIEARIWEACGGRNADGK